MSADVRILADRAEGSRDSEARDRLPPEAVAKTPADEGEIIKIGDKGAQDFPLLTLIGQRVRRLRGVRGLSQRALAIAAELSERYVAQLEAGRGNMSITLLARVARALDAPLEDIVADPAPAFPDWAYLRDRLAKADAAQIEAVKAILRTRAE